MTTFASGAERSSKACLKYCTVAGAADFSIFSRPRPVFVNLNSQVFFVPWPISPGSQTVFSKEILDREFNLFALYTKIHILQAFF